VYEHTIGYLLYFPHSKTSGAYFVVSSHPLRPMGHVKMLVVDASVRMKLTHMSGAKVAAHPLESVAVGYFLESQVNLGFGNTSTYS